MGIIKAESLKITDLISLKLFLYFIMQAISKEKAKIKGFIQIK